MILRVYYFQILRLVFTDIQRIFSLILTERGVTLTPRLLALVPINYSTQHLTFEEFYKR